MTSADPYQSLCDSPSGQGPRCSLLIICSKLIKKENLNDPADLFQQTCLQINHGSIQAYLAILFHSKGATVGVFVYYSYAKNLLMSSEHCKA